MKTYRAEYADENFEIFSSDNDDNALIEAINKEKEHGVVFEIFEVDEDYNEVRTVW